MFTFSNKADFHFHQNDKIVTADFSALLKATQHRKMDCDSIFYFGKNWRGKKKKKIRKAHIRLNLHKFHTNLYRRLIADH